MTLFRRRKPTLSKDDLHEENCDPPSEIIKDLYLEINNIAQGINIGILVLVLTPSASYSIFIENYFSTPLFILTNLIVSVVFWSRYYFDTEILNRSYTVLSATWFFLYLVSQGVSISLVHSPIGWLASTGVFLFFGSGFYVLNLAELHRKQECGVLPLWPNFVKWQQMRMVELFVISVTSLYGAKLVFEHPVLSFPAGVISLLVAIWQLVITNDYRRLKFIKTGT